MSEKIALCGDIGGTSNDLDIVRFNGEKRETEFVKHTHTPDTNQFLQMVKKYLRHVKEKKGLEPDLACFAAAGPVKDGRVDLPNANLTIDIEELKENTPLNRIILINDFSAIGYATNILTEDDYKVIQEGKPVVKEKKAVVGAGTGLGKSILAYNNDTKAYLPHSSEGGHADLPLFNEEEFKLADYISEKRAVSRLSYEEILSGRGIEIIYEYLRQKEYVNSAENLTAKQISNTMGRNPCSNETFNTFMKFYARCIRNFALETYSIGGIYIAGGIAAKNPEMFDDEFVERLHNVPNSRFSELMKDIPVKVITNQKIGLKGAAEALRLKDIV